MISLEFPSPAFQIRDAARGAEVFDSLRKKWLLLTPEEWVRQNLVAYLTRVAGIPAALIALERTLKVGELVRRFDLVVYQPDMQPWMLAECKAMEVSLSDKTVSQALSYCSGTRVRYMLITNGRFSFLWDLSGLAPQMLTAFPAFAK